MEGTDGARRTVEVTRQEIHGVTATWTMTENQVGLVTILNFYAGTADLVKQGGGGAPGGGAQALVFDLRNNPGDTSQSSRRFWTIFSQRNIFISRTNDGEEVTYTSDASCVDLPMAVLVNANSYSAAEFFAAQLRESVGAPVIGEQTSGKGYSQILFDLPDGGLLACLRPGTIPARGCLSLAQGLRRTQRLPSVRRTSRNCWWESLPRQRTRSFRPQWRRWASRKAAWPGASGQLSHHFP